jgi:diadenosine tetraphosphatase ApaH/serine/threonine PP2A family protein phosphatase
MKQNMEQVDLPKYPPLIIDGPGPFAIIGDIHGCFEELDELIFELENKYKNLTYISLGDVTDRGPEVHKCINLLQTVGAKMVLGNHDEKLVRWKVGRPTHMGKSQEVSMLQLTDADFAWIRSSYRYIQLPQQKSVLVHGGFFPGIPYEQQGLKSMIRLRNIDPGTSKMYTLTEPGGTFWAEAWPGPDRIIFGHAASWGEVANYPHAIGLDTGCVYGGRLTALVLSEEAVVGIETGICKAEVLGS